MKKALAKLLLRVTGWKTAGPVPDMERAVVIAAPHSSNWDFLYMLAFAAVYDVEIKWMGKHSLFRPPMGWIMRALGGMPIVRHRSGNIVASMVQAFEENEQLMLTVPAEGTRDRTDYWKSGFYHIARQAAVPILPSVLDWKTRTGGFRAPLMPSGNITADMDYLRSIYEPAEGKFPELSGPVRLKEEDS